MSRLTKATLKIRKIDKHAVLPAYAHDGDSGMDLFSLQDYRIEPGSRCLVSTGIAIAVPEGLEAQVRPRSGLALKNGISVLNTPGTIDSGYRGEIKIILINLGDRTFVVSRGMKVAQMVICPVVKADLQLCTELENSERNSGGFGSTGV